MPEQNEYFTNEDARLWVQLNGPGSALAHINCVDIGDSDEPQGDVNRELCPDPRTPHKQNVAIRTQGSPGEVSIQFTVPRGKTSDYLDLMVRRRCKIPFYVLYAICASMDVFVPLDTAEAFYGRTARWGMLTSKGNTNQGSRRPDGAAATGTMRTYTLSFESLEDWFKLKMELTSTAATDSMNSIAVFNRDVCGGECGAPEEEGDHLIAGGASAVAPAFASLYFSADGGATWTISAGNPHAAGEGISAVRGYPTGPGTYRVFALRGDTVAGTPAELGYSDDLGANWTNVVVGAVNTEFFPSGESLWIINRDLMFAVTDTGAGAGGNIYRGTDGGTVWELVATATDVLNCVHFLNDKEGIAGGETDGLYHTIDGGDTWESIGGAGGAEINCCVMLGSNHWIIGYAAGTMYQTFNAGGAWEAITINAPVAGAVINAVNSLRATDDHCVWAGIQYTAGGSVYGSLMRNVAGGVSNHWEHNVSGVTAASGYLSVWPCGYHRAFAIGGLTGGVAYAGTAQNI